jgi:hypothetical protein
MNYRTRSNDVRAQARNILVELRNERIAKKNLLAPRVDVAETIENNPSQSAQAEFLGSPELVSVLKEMFTKPRDVPPLSEVSLDAVPAEPVLAVEPVVKKKPSQKKPARRKVAAASPAPSPAPNSVPAAIEPIEIEPVASVPQIVAAVAPTIVEEPTVQPSPLLAEAPVAVSVEPALEHVEEQIAAPAAVLPIVSQDAPEPVSQVAPAEPVASSMPSKYALSPASDNISPFSLERLPMIGPGLVWHLQKAGVHSLDDLAFEDVDGLISRLGAISELMRLTDWIRLAKEQDQASSKVA